VKHFRIRIDEPFEQGLALEPEHGNFGLLDPVLAGPLGQELLLLVGERSSEAVREEPS